MMRADVTGRNEADLFIICIFLCRIEGSRRINEKIEFYLPLFARKE
jgi:hypothetical protein